jgi:hypothetical protein
MDVSVKVSRGAGRNDGVLTPPLPSRRRTAASLSRPARSVTYPELSSELVGRLTNEGSAATHRSKPH